MQRQTGMVITLSPVYPRVELHSKDVLRNCYPMINEPDTAHGVLCTYGGRALFRKTVYRAIENSGNRGSCSWLHVLLRRCVSEDSHCTRHRGPRRQRSNSFGAQPAESGNNLSLVLSSGMTRRP
ncbi:uncharacterized protein LOC143144447 isoform X2 [Ptiloglossa arizonensis]|uniref:uncharacterized protein LOC143144447 isoform X2 n=1 Tax=Ptiloglossa arizonensis TaxID=3350558 RepID=UPI003F9F53F8